MIKKSNVKQCYRFEDKTTCMHESVTELEGGEIECNDCKKIFNLVDCDPSMIKSNIENLDKIMDGIKFRVPMIHNKDYQAKLQMPIQKISRWLSIMKTEFPELCITLETMFKKEEENE